MNKSAAGAKKYYSETYYSEGKNKQLDYYSDKDQVIGKWGGKAAEMLGLQGDIYKDDFAALCDNRNPLNDKRLTGRNEKDRTVGYDFTFNASKSVSLAYSFADEKDKKEILGAFRESVADTMKEIETGMQARVRAKGADENRETGNIAYGEFVHFTTRPVDGSPDPHLHSHCFIFNVTYDEADKKWKAGQFRQINQDAPYYEAFFHSRLAEKLEQKGYNIERTRNGFELKGVEKETLDKFSRRTKEIEDYAQEHNITSDKQKAAIGARTRESKRMDANKGHEQAEWQSRLTEKEEQQLRNLKQQPGEGGSGITAKEAIEYVLDHHLERKSVASDKEILATAIRYSTGEVSPAAVKAAFHANPDIITIKENNRLFVTSRAALAEEKQLIMSANSLKGVFRPIKEDYSFKSGILNDQQKQGIHHALTSKDGIVVITGKAGTGKTTLMKEVKQGIEEAGMKIYSYAPSSEASRVVQRSEGFENADTIASLLKKKTEHSKLKGQVIWVDEAGMVSNKDMNGIMAIAKEQNARIILSGDTRQHNSVERGDALRILQKYAGVSSVTVSKIQRQKKAQYREAVEMLSNAKTEAGFKKLEAAGAIKEINDPKERVNAVAEDYCNSAFKGRKQQNVLVIAPTHAEGEAVTKAIRERLTKAGMIEAEGREYVTLKNLQFTHAEKQDAGNYKAGQVIGFTQNIKGIKAGTRLQIASVEREHIIAADKAGKAFEISLEAARNFSVFEKREMTVAKGDRIRITGNGKDTAGKHLFNGISYQITGFDRQGNIRLSNGSTLPKDYGQFAYGYVITSHTAQGKTSDKVIISQSSQSFRAGSMEQFYVSVSRGRHETAIYTDDKQALLQAVSQTNQRMAAHELVAKNNIQKAALERNRLSLFERLRNKAKDSLNKITITQNRDHELSGKNRSGPSKSR